MPACESFEPVVLLYTTKNFHVLVGILEIARTLCPQQTDLQMIVLPSGGQREVVLLLATQRCVYPQDSALHTSSCHQSPYVQEGLSM